METKSIRVSTLSAIEEARNGHTKAVDMSSYEAFVNSIFNDDEED